MTSPSYAAVRPGTDLGVHARALRRVHDAVLGGIRPPDAPRPLVGRSWQRVMELGLDPTRPNARDPLPRSLVEQRRRESGLSQVVDDIRSVLGSVADASRFIVVVTDAEATILWREGAPRVLMEADRLGFSEGACWTEEQVGTNAIGTALTEAAPVQLFSAEHFEEGQIPWYCTASPIHDPRTGDLLGIVDVSGPALTLHPALVALVETATRLAEAQLWRRHQERLDRLRRSAGPVLATTSGPLLVVDDHGWVAHHAGVSARDRIAVPAAQRTLAVPGLGLCVPERMGEGWLVRPSAGERTVTATLDLTGDEALLEVSSADGAWRTSLSRRHARLLADLHDAGREGLTAAALSRRTYGDDAHQVTVRAEVSRLRRVVGGLVTTGPYRISADVSLTVRR
ncbi:GAF domain-containing protein [Nocardioides marmoribigeumensis]|uniref:GAF domain-containing protein n=1 Tax=Nocardioides marmoribigeumensis TaxID=433649 RepID=A0ABU2BS34_9ACTN|nr:GAF domain-containing protein [Nocardioides marmoribigeumensis]MDR7361076.1 hypothetical protein [Nocardioides marmoribigeumensis]